MIDSNSIPRRYVPGRGKMPARLMFVGEAPGRNENEHGMPFIGQAGMELERYAASAGVDLSQAYITNLYKFWPLQDFKGKQLPPSPEQIKEGSEDLRLELQLVKPKIIVAVGAHSARFFLGPKKFQSMRRDWGIPHSMLLWSCGCVSHGSVSHTGHNHEGVSQSSSVVVVVPITHPAAGLHSEREQVQIQEGFLRLGRLLRGQIPPHPPVDEYPTPRYERLYDSVGDDQFTIPQILAGRTLIAIDTEGTIADPWCLTFSVRPGEAFLVRSTERECLEAINRHINAPHGICTVLLHNAAHDLPVLDALGVHVSKHRALNADGSLTIRDTMSEAYLLGTEPKGLKPLAYRLCGGEMRSYEDLVGPTEERISKEYLQLVWWTFLCETCVGEGKVPTRGVKMVADPSCEKCWGSGKIAVGKSGKPLKNPKPCDCRVEQEVELKSTEKCGDCVGGLQLPMPEKELIFDGQKGEFRHKQPQSLGKWIKRRLKDEGPETTSAEDSSDGNDRVEGAEVGIREEEEEPAAAYFKLRRDWRDLGSRNYRLIVEARLGPMPRTTLTEVEEQEGESAVTSYACADADFTLRIASKLDDRIAHLKLQAVREMDAAFVPMLSRMEQIGMRIDRPHFEEFQTYLTRRLEEIRESLSTLVGGPINPNSEKIADLFFNQLRLAPVKLTKSGDRESIDDDVLGALKARLQKTPEDGISRLGIQIIEHVTDYREHYKLKTSYVDKILLHADRNDRIHTTLNYTTVATGRLSSSDPINLQTLPNPDNYPASIQKDWQLNYGLRTRGGFIAKPGYKLGSADFSQIEMVVGAHLTQDPGMLQVFRDGLDLHYYAASLMFGIAYDQVPKAIRTQVKPLNFGAFYGLSAIGLQAQFASFPSGAIEKSERECQELIDRYYAAFSGVMAWKERLWAEAERTGYVRDLFGRIRWVPGLRSRIKKVRASAEREAANMPVQSTANGIIRIASRTLWEETLPSFWDMGIDVEVTMQTHDENVFEAPEEWIEPVMQVSADVMKNAVELSVPIKVGVSIGGNLAQCK